MASCIVCNKLDKNEKVFCAPTNDSKRRLWSESIGIELTPLSKVCEKHFLKSDFINAPGSSNPKRFRLQPGAVPSLQLGHQANAKKHWKPITSARQVLIIPKNCTQTDSDISAKTTKLAENLKYIPSVVLGQTGNEKNLQSPIVLGSTASCGVKKNQAAQVFHIPTESIRKVVTVSKDCSQKNSEISRVNSLQLGQSGNEKYLQNANVLRPPTFCAIKNKEVSQVVHKPTEAIRKVVTVSKMVHIPTESIRKVVTVSKDCIQKNNEISTKTTKVVENIKYVPSLQLGQSRTEDYPQNTVGLRPAAFCSIKNNEVSQGVRIPTASIRKAVTLSKDCIQKDDIMTNAPNAVNNRKYVFSFELGKPGNQNKLCKPVILSPTNQITGIRNNDVGKVFHIPTESLRQGVNLAENSSQQNDDYVKAKHMEIENMNLKKRVKALEQEICVLKEKVVENEETLCTLTNIFTEGQIRKMRCPNKQIHWQWDDISSAISLHAAGPKAYRHLYNKGFPLPCVSTLIKWTRKMKLKEGIQQFALDCMKYSYELSDDEKLCVLSFDELKIANEKEQTLDLVKTPINLAQVAMVRGLNASWKYPIFYAFNTKMSKSIIYFIIQELYKAGFNVLALVSNMSPSNRTLWKELNVSTEKTWFSNPANEEEKIFVFADVPHLLKLIRNNFLDSGIKYKNGIVTAQTLRQLIQYTCACDIRIAHTITSDHLCIKIEDEQKVELAAELFSDTTANALEQCYALRKDMYNALDTADFMRLVNEWFGLLNSKMNHSQTTTNKPYGFRVTHQNAVLEKMNHLMSQPVIPDSTTLAPFQKGVLITNTSVRLMYEYVKEKYNMDYLLTYKLNQAMLEEFFHDMKHNGNPSAMDFKYRLRKYIIEKNTEILSNRGHLVAYDTEQPSSSTRSALSLRNDGKKAKTEEMFDFCTAAAADVIKRLNDSTNNDTSLVEEGIVIKTEDTFDYY